MSSDPPTARILTSPRFVFPESIDVANGILFLASDESKMITGTELVIDGGLSAQ